jgi:hypothetical protein
MDAERMRLTEDVQRAKQWKRWGPYLAERQWGTVREDYSEDGDSWTYLPHDHARSRAYRWGEDGLLGISDRQGRLCFALALWNGRDPILKERLFGLTGPEGNHGEDVKELYYYLACTPTHSYMKALYRYPQAPFPYARLVEENRRRGRLDGEFELADSGVFDDDRYFDVFVEYAKADADDVLIRITIANRGPEAARLDVLPTLWFRNTWSVGRSGPEYPAKPAIARRGAGELRAHHATLGTFLLVAESVDGNEPAVLFTENETNFERLYGVSNATPHVKDAFHRYVIDGDTGAVNPEETGTKAAFRYVVDVPSRAELTLRLRLTAEADVVRGDSSMAKRLGPAFDELFRQRIREADQFYAARELGATLDERNVSRQAYAGLLWSKQFYYYVTKEWLEGDPAYPAPPATRRSGRNHEWTHVHNRDIISLPDKWEYPWYAAWDLAFHVVAFAQLDPEFAKQQLLLFLREWYMHPNGQIPAYNATAPS